MKNLKSLGKKNQKGFTLIEIMVALAIVAVIYLIVGPGYTAWKRNQGATEGKLVGTALTCSMTNVQAANFAATTIATLTNLTCFGEGSNVVGRGTAAATTNSKLTGTPYVVAPVGVGGGANNGLSIATSPVPSTPCVGMVTDLNAYAAQIDVTPVGGALVTVKPFGGVLNDDAVGTACAAANTAIVTAIGTRS